MNRTHLSVPAYLMITLHGMNVPLHAAVVMDGSLGAAGALEGPAYQVEAGLGHQTEGNLFHSFSQFSLTPAESATFSGKGTINNVISRVTGNELSFIDGQLNSSMPGANLYFFNPAGVQLGTHASVNIGGSLFLSSADYLSFPDNTKFSTHELNGSQFSAAQPSAFGFLSTPQPLQLALAELALPTTQKLHLSGGDINIENSFVNLPTGTLELISGASAGAVNLQNATDTFSQYGTIHINNGAYLSVSANTAGSVYLKAHQIHLTDANIDLETTNGNAGNLLINTHDLDMDRANFFTMTASTGQGAQASIQARGTVRLQHEADISSGSCSGSDCQNPEISGNSGAIEISAHNLYLETGSRINSSTFGGGRGGDIQLNIANNFNVSGTYEKNPGTATRSGLYSNTEIASGNAGDISVNAGNIHLTDQGIITSTTFSSGNSGQIQITTTDSITIQDNALIQNSATHTGNAGNIQLTVGHSLHLSNPGNPGATQTAISTQAVQGSGQGGDISIQAQSIEAFDGARITSETFSAGHAGDISIIANQLTLSGSNAVNETTKISSASRSTGSNAGNSGNISIQAETLALLDRANIGNLTEGSGKGGSISIQAQTVALSDNADINSESRSLEANAGNAGEIAMSATDKLSLSTGAKITTASKQAGGGQITLNHEQLLYLNHAEITTSVQTGSGNGGDINIHRPEFVVLNHGKIIAQAIDGNGGNIFIGSKHFLPSTGGVVDASSQRGIDGQVLIDSPDANMFNELIALSSDFLPSDELSRTPCGSQTGNQSRFFMRRREGMPDAEDDWLPSGLLLRPAIVAPLQAATIAPGNSLPMAAFSTPCRLQSAKDS